MAKTPKDREQLRYLVSFTITFALDASRTEKSARSAWYRTFILHPWTSSVIICSVVSPIWAHQRVYVYGQLYEVLNHRMPFSSGLREYHPPGRTVARSCNSDTQKKLLPSLIRIVTSRCAAMFSVFLNVSKMIPMPVNFSWKPCTSPYNTYNRWEHVPYGENTHGSIKFHHISGWVNPFDQYGAISLNDRYA
jgi:hypothetical protein